MLLEFYNLSYHFDISGRFIQESGTVGAGEILALRGPSGVGKSTLLKILTRLIQPDKGKVSYCGDDWYSFSPMEWRAMVHYLPQKPVVFAGSVEDNLRMPFNIAAIKEKQPFNQEKMVNLMSKLDIPPDMLTQEASTLSGGEASRITLIRALLIEPQILLLDEPTASLDGESRNKVIKLLGKWVKEKPNRGIILVSHQDDDLKKLPGIKMLNLQERRSEPGA